MQEVERIGISEKKLKRIRFFSTLFQIPFGIIGLFLMIMGVLDGSETALDLAMVGVIFFIIPLFLRFKYPFVERYMEISNDGIRQGKKFIPWDELMQAIWMKEKRGKHIEEKIQKGLIKSVERGYFYFERKDKQYIRVLLKKLRRVTPDFIIKSIVERANLERIKKLPKTDFNYGKFRSNDLEKMRGLWRNDVLYKQWLEYKKLPKPFPENLRFSNWNLTVRRLVGGTVILIDIVYMITMSVLLVFQGSISSQFTNLLMPIGVLNIIFFSIAASSGLKGLIIVILAAFTMYVVAGAGEIYMW